MDCIQHHKLNSYESSFRLIADTVDSMSLYLNEAGAIPLLTRESERSADMNTLIESNLRLVVSIAKRYQNCGMPLFDLIQEGNIGLIKAARNFDGARGRFTTLADVCIRHQIMDALKAQKATVELTTPEEEPGQDDVMFDGLSTEFTAVLQTLQPDEYQIMMLSAAGFPPTGDEARKTYATAVRKLVHPSRFAVFRMES